MGANGSGKSTLVKALVGLRPLVSGDAPAVRHPARRLRRLAPDRVRAAAGRARRPAYPRPCGRSSPPAGSRGGGCSACSRAPTGPRSPRRSTSSASTHRAGDGISQLSGGQQQRVLIARALAGRARAVLPRRADRRRRPAQPARRWPTRSTALKDARLDDRPGRPRARPARAARRPGRGDARRAPGLRRRSARRPGRARPLTRPRSPPRPASRTTTRPTSRRRWSRADGASSRCPSCSGPCSPRSSPGWPRRPSAPTWSSAGWR